VEVIGGDVNGAGVVLVISLANIFDTVMVPWMQKIKIDFGLKCITL